MVNDLLQFGLGVFIGATLVGSSTQRTISTFEGSLVGSTFANLMNGIAYFFSVKFVAKDNYIAFIGTMVGSLIVIAYMTIKNRIKRGREKDIRGNKEA